MNALEEQITKACDCVRMAVDDLLQANKIATLRRRPEGATLGDKALQAYLSDAIELARQLESKIERIRP